MNVFKKIVFVVLLIVGCKFCFAQEISLRGGFNLSKFRYKAVEDVFNKDRAKFNTGFSAGPIFEIPIKNMFSLETGILFNTKGNKLAGRSSAEKRIIHYLDVPVLLKASLPVRKTKIFGMAGMYAGSALYGTHINKYEETPALNREYIIQWGNKPGEYDRLDYGLKFGAGIKVLRYQIGASYEMGLKNIANGYPYKIRNRVIEFYLAYQLLKFNKVINNTL